MVYDLDYVLGEVKKASTTLLNRGFKPLFMFITFKLRLPLPPCEDFLYYVTCFTMISSEEELEKAIMVYADMFRSESVIDFGLRENYQWRLPDRLLKSLDEVFQEVNKAREEFENRIRQKLPKEVRDKPIIPSHGPITITLVFQEDNLTFGIDLIEDYYRIEVETIEALLKYLKTTSRILGYMLETSALEEEPEVKDYRIEDGFVHVELKHELED
ncbi:MAG: hypothetical protein DRJ31_08165 [Candidatus Methanomethylicota archaeon]|uniref:Uncharacterized protein n=1 Tax=Thermoproteota archaeon TaxID=2056631 RepID=A0A497ELN6_9CREN|nr:MAG: hypothetical protein DRJ31_08165 [Candidatus Verstraetearchaeota archaeon]